MLVGAFWTPSGAPEGGVGTLLAPPDTALSQLQGVPFHLQRRGFETIMPTSIFLFPFRAQRFDADILLLGPVRWIRRNGSFDTDSMRLNAEQEQLTDRTYCNNYKVCPSSIVGRYHPMFDGLAHVQAPSRPVTGHARFPRVLHCRSVVSLHPFQTPDGRQFPAPKLQSSLAGSHCLSIRVSCQKKKKKRTHN